MYERGERRRPREGGTASCAPVSISGALEACINWIADVSGKWKTGRDSRVRSTFVQRLLVSGIIEPLCISCSKDFSSRNYFCRVPETFSSATFLMAFVNLDHVQFWDPLSNSFVHRQYAASLNSISKSTYITSSRNQPTLLYNKPAGIFKRNGPSTFVIVPA